VTDSEWQFLVNVTCHLTANCPRTNPDSVKRTVTQCF
jgi:hypothetical protein